jgi:hypothetical protein
MKSVISLCLLEISILMLIGASPLRGQVDTAASPGRATLKWKSHTWRLTNGGMAGVAKGNGSNISVDHDGFLHLRIFNRNGTYTASEMFSTDKMGFGTYQWWLEGNLAGLDKTTVLGLFPYGPEDGIGVDGENEIDIEFSRWDNTCQGCNADFTFYPATGYKSLEPATDNFNIDLSRTTLFTARVEWSSTEIVGTIMSGLQPLGTTANVLQTFDYAPQDSAKHIPQVALPLGMNFWCFQALPASDQEVTVRDFKFSPGRD